MKPTKLTSKLLASLQTGERVRDTTVRGLFAECGLNGVSLKVQADLWIGERGKRTLARTVRITLGKHPALSIEAARTAAMAKLALIKAGIDPNASNAPAPGELTVGGMFAQYVEHMRILGRADRSIADVEYVLEKYLPHLRNVAVSQIKPSTLAGEHLRITNNHGKLVANKAIKAFGTAYKLAGKRADNKTDFGDNPTRGVTYHPTRKREAVILPSELRDWFASVRALPRGVMHELGLFSGLRPGTLVSIERSWIQLADKAIVIPRMKSGRSFALPLSAHMIELVERALESADKLYPGSAWLFPTRSADGREIIATQVWKEKKLPGKTGHILRHTYRNLAQSAGVDDVDIELLLDHKVPGVKGVYVHARALMDRLLAQQDKVSAHILSLIQSK
jgi:integrase